MDYLKVVFCLFLTIYACLTPVQGHPMPDSAGIIDLPPGLAYGGIPYGSVTGMVAKYYQGQQRSLRYNGQQERQPLRPVYYD